MRKGKSSYFYLIYTYEIGFKKCGQKNRNNIRSRPPNAKYIAGVIMSNVNICSKFSVIFYGLITYYTIMIAGHILNRH